MRPFIMSEAQRREIGTLKKYAEEHPVTFDEIIKCIKREVEPAGKRKEYYCIIPVGFKVVFTIEAHSQVYEDSGVWARHISVSVPDDKRLPNTYVIKELLPMFGFLTEYDSGYCHVYIDENAINVVEFYNIHDNTVYTPPQKDGQDKVT